MYILLKDNLPLKQLSVSLNSSQILRGLVHLWLYDFNDFCFIKKLR